MPISMECPSCLHGFSLPVEMAGRKTKCPECQFALFVPRPKTKVDAAAGAPPETVAAPDAPLEPKKEPSVVANPSESGASQIKKTVARPTAATPSSASPLGGNKPDHPSHGKEKALFVALFAVALLGGMLLLGGGLGVGYFWGRYSPPEVANSSPEVKPDDGAIAPPVIHSQTPPVKVENLTPSPVEKPPPPPPPLQLAIDLGDGVKMEFVLIDPKSKPDGGKFKMGSPPDEVWHNPWEKRFDAEMQHEVQITMPFYLAIYPVTQAQYARLAGNNPSHFRQGGGGENALKDLADKDTSQFPVEMVSWNDATAFCTEQMAKYREQIPAVMQQRHYRFALPTEAQWEYACRAGTTTPFSFGTILNGTQANCDGTVPYGTAEKGPYLQRTTKVGSYTAIPWGLCDMHGNVFQWCEDYYGPYEGLPEKDPLQTGTPAGTNRVHRGGSWQNHSWVSRAAIRPNQGPDARGMSGGFRVAIRQN